jgi:hypothetical protein
VATSNTWTPHLQPRECNKSIKDDIACLIYQWDTRTIWVLSLKSELRIIYDDKDICKDIGDNHEQQWG